MANINDFKANLKAVAQSLISLSNQFRVTLTLLSIGGETVRSIFSNASIFDAKSWCCCLSVVVILTLLVIEHLILGLLRLLNDTDFLIRNAMERWITGSMNMTDNTGVIAFA